MKKKKSKVNMVVIRPVVEDATGKYRLYTVGVDGKRIPILDISGNPYESGEFIFKNLYKTLDFYLNEKRVTDDFVDIISDIPLTEFDVVFEVLKKGKELNFLKI